MASSLQSIVKTIQESDYVAFVILTAVGYDYILTFADEVEYIWTKRWSWVSLLFFFARYFGLCTVIIFSSGETLVTFGTWVSMFFVGAADLVMILRLGVLYNRSKFILGTLLTFYAMEIIAYFVYCLLLTVQNQIVGETMQVFQFTLCAFQDKSPIWPEAMDIIQLVLGALMCLLVAINFIRQSIRAYEATKRFQLSHYMNLFTREGMFYFLAVLSYTLANLLGCITPTQANGWWILIAGYIPAFTLVPRFILSLRRLYALDLKGKLGNDIDTAFGLGSSGRGGVVSTIQFADNGQNAQSEETSMDLA